MSIALDMTGENLWNGASEINWPHMAGQVLLAFIDPSVSLEGVIAGLNGVLSGAANLFSLEQWERDPLGNLLKSSADIATGLTTLLGSIAGFCTAILVILGALAIFTFGAMGPAFAAASAFLGPVISTVGGWALVTAAIAAELHALVFIKNLIDAATADTAAELEHESDQMTEDATQFANAASQVVLDRIVEAGGARLANTPTGKSLGAAIETVGRDFDMIPPPRMRAGIDGPAGALAEGAPGGHGNRAGSGRTAGSGGAARCRCGRTETRCGSAAATSTPSTASGACRDHATSGIDSRTRAGAGGPARRRDARDAAAPRRRHARRRHRRPPRHRRLRVHRNGSAERRPKESGRISNTKRSRRRARRRSSTPSGCGR